MVNNNTGWWCNNNLENDGVRQWEGWHPTYEMENKKWSKPPTRVGLMWQCVKTLYPFCSHQNSCKWMFIPLKMVLIDIDPYPCVFEVIPKYGAEFMILQIRAIPQFRNFPELNFVFQHFQDRKSMKISVHVLFLSCFKQPLSVISDIFRRALNEWPQSHLAANPFSTNMAN